MRYSPKRGNESTKNAEKRINVSDAESTARYQLIEDPDMIRCVKMRIDVTFARMPNMITGTATRPRNTLEKCSWVCGRGGFRLELRDRSSATVNSTDNSKIQKLVNWKNERYLFYSFLVKIFAMAWNQPRYKRPKSRNVVFDAPCASLVLHLISQLSLGLSKSCQLTKYLFFFFLHLCSLPTFGIFKTKRDMSGWSQKVELSRSMHHEHLISMVSVQKILLKKAFPIVISMFYCNCFFLLILSHPTEIWTFKVQYPRLTSPNLHNLSSPYDMHKKCWVVYTYPPPQTTAPLLSQSSNQVTWSNQVRKRAATGRQWN